MHMRLSFEDHARLRFLPSDQAINLSENLFHVVLTSTQSQEKVYRIYVERIKDDADAVRERRIAYAEINLSQFASTHLAEQVTQQEIPLIENGKMLLSVRCVRLAAVEPGDRALDRSPSADPAAHHPSPADAAARALRREFLDARNEAGDIFRALCAAFDELESRQIRMEEENRWLRAEADQALVRAGFAEARAAAARAGGGGAGGGGAGGGGGGAGGGAGTPRPPGSEAAAAGGGGDAGGDVSPEVRRAVRPSARPG
jgi:hypothetical protein